MIKPWLGAALALATASPAAAQTLNMMKSIDAPHYDAQRTTWAPTADIVNMIQDTLVASSTGTARRQFPYLAKSWTVSPDGKLYTFKLRDDVTFCRRQEVHRRGCGLQLQAAEGPGNQGPFAWRAGDIKELRAPDPTPSNTSLPSRSPSCCCSSPCSPTSSTTRRASRRWADYGLKGADGTGPWCFVSWQPRTEIVLKRHGRYKWGPSMYQNKGPVKFEKLSIKIVPEDLSRALR
jgi:peptide/nickel transport system substrate-binding protein